MRFSYRVYDVNSDYIFSYHEHYKKMDDRSEIAYKIYYKVKEFFEDHKGEFPQVIEIWKYNVSANKTRKLMCVANYDTDQEEKFSIAFTNEFTKTFRNRPKPAPKREYTCEFINVFENMDLADTLYINDIPDQKLNGDDNARFIS